MASAEQRRTRPDRATADSAESTPAPSRCTVGTTSGGTNDGDSGGDGAGTVASRRNQLAERIGLLPEPVRTSGTTDVAELVRAGLDARLRKVLDHDPGTYDGDSPEDLHQMRVSVRRMRAMLKSGRAFLDQSWSEPLRAELGWLGRALGPVRDLDVLLARLTEQIADLPETADLPQTKNAATDLLLQRFSSERAQARVRMREALDSERYFQLLGWIVEITSEPLSSDVSDGANRLRELTSKQYRKLAQEVRELPTEPTDEELHSLRIRGKRLRYTAELAAQTDGKRLHQLCDAAKRLQDELGEHQDACVAARRVRGLVGELGAEAPPELAFTAGRLVEREERRRIERRARWPAAWRKVRKVAAKL